MIHAIVLPQITELCKILDNFDEIKLVMSYVLSSEDYYEMIEMNNIEKIKHKSRGLQTVI